MCEGSMPAFVVIRRSRARRPTDDPQFALALGATAQEVVADPDIDRDCAPSPESLISVHSNHRNERIELFAPVS